MSLIDSVVLVELYLPTYALPVPQIMQVIRTYDSKGRADEDVDLLQQLCPERRFLVQSVAYIDR